jgi:ABC-2 type transport system permease protein
MGIFPLILKDIKIVLSDKKAFVTLIGMPIILFVILSFALQGSFSSGSNGVWDIKIGLVKGYDFENDYKALEGFMTRDQALEIENIVPSVFDSPGLEFVQYQWLTYDEGMKALEDNSLTSLIVLPKYFVKDIVMNMSPMEIKTINIEVLKNPEKEYGASIITKIVTELSDNLSSQMIQRKVVEEFFSNEEITPKNFNFNYQQEPIDLRYKNESIEELKSVTSGQYYSVAMMAMFILFGASYGSKFMLLEKRRFTLQRQKVAGVSPFALVVGKLVVIFFVGMIQILAMIVTSKIGFNVYWGQPLRLFVLVVLTAFSVMGFGTILTGIALRANSFKAVNVLESGVFQVIALFGGSYFPIFLMPDWFQSVSKVLLNGAALNTFLKLMMDASLKEMLPGMLSLLLNGLLFLIIGLGMIYFNPSIRVRREL